MTSHLVFFLTKGIASTHTQAGEELVGYPIAEGVSHSIGIYPQPLNHAAQPKGQGGKKGNGIGPKPPAD